MARIAEYRQQVGIQSTSQPGAQLRNPVAEEANQLGGALQTLGHALVDRQERREDFEIAAELRDAQHQINLSEIEAEVPVGGAGYHASRATAVDGFLAPVMARIGNLPPDRQAAFLAQVSGVRNAADLSAAATEMTAMRDFQSTTIESAIEDAVSNVTTNPSLLDTESASIYTMIEASNLDGNVRDALNTSVARALAGALITGEIERNPAGALTMLGRGMSTLTPGQRAAYMQQTMAMTGAAPAASTTRATNGLHVAAARAMAADVDPEGAPPADASDEEWATYLSNGRIGAAYQNARLAQISRAFPDDPEAAMVAYYTDDETARAWADAGKDWAQLDPSIRAAARANASAMRPTTADPSRIPLVWVRDGANVPATRAELGRVDDDLVARTQQAFADMGLTEIRIVSAERSVEGNAEADGATNSQHIMFDEHGHETGSRGALDIALPANMSREDKIRLIERLSAAGIQGIGVYANSIHVDLGARRAWGSDHRGSSIPSWASEVIARHVNGDITSMPPRNVDPRVAALPEGERRRAIDAAASALSPSATAMSESLAAQRAETLARIRDHTAALERGLPGVEGFDLDAALSDLTATQRVKAEQDVQVATVTGRLLEDAATMSSLELSGLLDDIGAQAELDPTTVNQRIAAAVNERVREVQTMRASDPARAAAENPEVRAAYDAAFAPGTTPDPVAVQNYIRMTMAEQARFNLRPGGAVPLPRSVASAIADSLTATTRTADGTGATRPRQEQVASARALYWRLHSTFGEYTDEVMLQALSLIEGNDDEGSPEAYLATQLARIGRGGTTDINLPQITPSAASPAAPAVPATAEDAARLEAGRAELNAHRARMGLPPLPGAAPAGTPDNAIQATDPAFSTSILRHLDTVIGLDPDEVDEYLASTPMSGELRAAVLSAYNASRTR